MFSFIWPGFGHRLVELVCLAGYPVWWPEISNPHCKTLTHMIYEIIGMRILSHFSHRFWSMHNVNKALLFFSMSTCYFFKAHSFIQLFQYKILHQLSRSCFLLVNCIYSYWRLTHRTAYGRGVSHAEMWSCLFFSGVMRPECSVILLVLMNWTLVYDMQRIAQLINTIAWWNH